MRWLSSLAAVLLVLGPAAGAQEPDAAPGPSAPGTTVTPPDTAGVAGDTTAAPEPVGGDDAIVTEGASDTARVPGLTESNGGETPALPHCGVPAQRRAAQVGVGAVFVGTNLELFRRFKNAWWSGEKADRFFFQADWDMEFRDQDKFGHMWGGYTLTRGGYTLLRGACVSERRAVLYSALYATLFQLQIEIWDGFYEKYGFSYPDMIANTVGMGLGVLHAVRPSTRALKPTISYRRTAAMKDQQPGDEVRYSIDYSGQTYWFSLDVDAILPPAAQRYWPGILRLSAGHSITDWILPRPSNAEPGTPQQVVRARRRILLSLDLDPTKLPGNHPAWVFIKEQLSYYRFPAPALQLTPSTEFIRWYR